MEQKLKRELRGKLSTIGDGKDQYYSDVFATLFEGFTILPKSVSDPIKVEDQTYMFTIKTAEYGDLVIHLYSARGHLYNIAVSVHNEEGLYVYMYNNSYIAFYNNLSIRTLKELMKKEAELRKYNKTAYDEIISKLNDENFYKLNPEKIFAMFDSVGLVSNQDWDLKEIPFLKDTIAKMQSQNRENGLNYELEVEIETKLEHIETDFGVANTARSLCKGLPIEPDSVSYGIYTPHGDKYYFNIITTNGQKINFFAKISGKEEEILGASLNTAEGTYIYQNGKLSFYDNAAKEELQSKEKYVETYWLEQWRAIQKELEETYIRMLEWRPISDRGKIDLAANKAPSFDFSNLLSSADPDVIVESFKCVGIEPSFILDDNEEKTFVNAMKKREEVYGGSSMKFQKNM